MVRRGSFWLQVTVGVLAVVTLRMALGAHAKAPATAQPQRRAPVSQGPEAATQFVVLIRGTIGDAPTAGAGIIIGLANDQFYVATANHVIRRGASEAKDLRVQLNWRPGEWVSATVLDHADTTLDLAVIAVPEASKLGIPQFTWATLARPEALTPRTRVFPIGYPGGNGWLMAVQPHLVSTVTISVIRTEGNLVDGHSGGALVTEDGGIVGLVSNVDAVLSESQRIDRVVEKLAEWRYGVSLTWKPVNSAPGPPTPSDPKPPPGTAVNGFRNLTVSEVSPSEMRVSVEYTYTGDLGESPPIIPIVRANGQTNNAMVYEYIDGRARAGTRRAFWTIYGDLTSPWESDEVRFCIIDTSRSRPPFCENLPYRKRWAVPERRRVADNQISNFQAQDVSSKELRVSVTYQYVGEAGLRPFRVYMSAEALQRDKQQVPRTHFEGLGGSGGVRLGVGRSTMLINKQSDDAATSYSVRVCINSQSARGELTQVLCQEFPYRKDWR